MKLTYAPPGTDDRSPEPEPPTRAQRASTLLARASRRFPRAGAMLVLAGLLVVVNVMHIQGYAFLSPYDENHHIDYTYRASRGQIVIQPDELFAEEVLPEFACHGTQVAGWPECGRDRYFADDFGWRGVNSAVGHTPYYYVATGVPARALAALPLTPNSLVTWARFLGTVWLLLGCYLTLRAADALGIKRWVTVLALLLLGVTPVVLHATNTVNPDASAFLGGALLVTACLAWDRGRPLWMLGAAAFACAALDPTNGVALILGLLFLGARAAGHFMTGRDGRDGGEGGAGGEALSRSARDYLWAALVVVGAGALAVLSWRVLYNLLADNQQLLELHPNHRHFVVDHFDLEWLVGRDALFDNFPPIYGSIVPDVLRTEPRVLFASATGFLIIGAVFVAIMGPGPRTSRMRASALATLGALLLATPALTIYNYVFDGVRFMIPTRMLLSLLPAVAIVVAYACASRIARYALAGVTAGAYLAALVPLADRFRV